MADEYKAMSDAELQAKTPEFKTRLQSGETLDDILPAAFATVREASRRVLGLYLSLIHIYTGAPQSDLASRLPVHQTSGPRGS